MGSLFSGLLFSPVLLLPAAWLPTWCRAAIFVALLLCVLVDLSGIRRIRFPQNARQVPQSIAHADPAIGAFRFGVEMGTGLRTFSPSGLPHLLLAALFLVGRAGGFVPAALGFGIGRALMTRGAVVATRAWVVGWDARRAAVSWLGVVVVVLPAVGWACAP